MSTYDVLPSMKKKIDRSDHQDERMVHPPVFKSVPSKSRMTCETKLLIDVVAAISPLPIILKRGQRFHSTNTYTSEKETR